MYFRSMLAAALVAVLLTGHALAAAPLKALIVDGQNNHPWKETTPLLKPMLEQTGLFAVDVATAPAKGQDLSEFKPDFAAYDVVVMNYNGAEWSESTKQAFVDYVRDGGGLVIYHAADNSFAKWPEYNEMIGLGGWGGRSEKDGPYVYYKDGQLVRDRSPGRGGSHGPQHPFQMVVREPNHPITAGLPEKFMHSADELYNQLRGPAKNMTVLATAHSPQDQRGTGRDEPMLMTIDFGQGRVFHHAAGHAGKQLKSVAFIVTFQRGTEWAATGKVTQPVPEDFPRATLRPKFARVNDISKLATTYQEITMKRTSGLWALAVLALVCSGIRSATAADPWIVYEGQEGPGVGKHIVFVTGDEEYRSEESMPQLAKIAATQHGFKCTVLFAIDKQSGEINPTQVDNIPGLEALESADLMVLFVRFRHLPAEQMKRIMDYTNSGRPIVALRTSTHPFDYRKDKENLYAKWCWRSNTPGFEGGYGRQVLGETWVNHYGHHQVESTRGLIPEGVKDHPIVRGCCDIWGPSDVYGLTTLQGDCQPLVLGQVLKGMQPDDEPNPDKKVVPVAWIKSHTGESGKAARVFTTTMGHGGDLKSEGFRRLLMNAIYWGLGMEDKISGKAKVDIVGEYDPAPIGFGGHKTGLNPADHAL